MKRASYRNAIEWIAYNDDPACEDFDDIRSQLTVVLVADLFDKKPDEVARDVEKSRIKLGIVQ